MSRSYVPMKFLEGIDSFIGLSQESPSGLVWKRSYRGNKPGDHVGFYDKRMGIYRFSFKAFRLVAHRVVYYLRTGVDPLDADVIHDHDNPEKDNRKGLRLTKAWQPKKAKKTQKSPYEQFGDSYAIYRDSIES